MNTEITHTYRHHIWKWAKRLFVAIAAVHLIFIIIMGATLFLLRSWNPPVTSLMLYREHVYGYRSAPVTFAPFSTIPDDIIKMVIATEDYQFYSHFGIDIEAIKRAYFINRKVGYRMFGGSTITQQISRTLFLLPKKILLRKYAEMIIAIEMDLILPKERILELYLNYCEWGHGVYGIAAAARHHYNRDFRELTVDQTARLITILANPIDYSPATFGSRKFLAYRYNIIKFRYYTYLKFHNLSRRRSGIIH